MSSSDFPLQDIIVASITFCDSDDDDCHQNHHNDKNVDDDDDKVEQKRAQPKLMQNCHGLRNVRPLSICQNQNFPLTTAVIIIIIIIIIIVIIKLTCSKFVALSK